MKSNRELTFDAVVADPEDDAARLVHADAIQEESGDEALAALVRAGVLCHCARADASSVPPGPCLSCGGSHWQHRCQEGGCRSAGRRCVLDAMTGEESDDREEWFCDEHAGRHGYCPVCGSFWGGISSFEMHGMCDHCRDSIENDFDEGSRHYDDEWDGDIDGIMEYGEDHT